MILPSASITVLKFTMVPEITEVTIDDLYSVLDFGFSYDYITHQGIYNSLKAKVDVMLKHRDSNKKVQNSLNALKNEVTAQSGKKLDAEFAALLLNYIDFLKSVYIGD